MKKILVFLLFTCTVLQAQYKISGTLTPPNNYKNALLYKVEGARQLYIKNAKIKLDTIIQNKTQKIIGSFQFVFNNDMQPGSYRVTYDLQNGGFADFLFNKENVSFTVNPNAPQPIIKFLKSKENILYSDFLNDISLGQYETDSLQIAYLKDPSLKNAKAYKSAIKNIQEIQAKYVKNSEGALVSHFIKATDRYNAPEPAKTPNQYFNGVLSHFFDNIDFTNTYLYNSSFLIDRISDYVFYMNYTEDRDQQLVLHKNAIDKVMSVIENQKFKADVIEFLASQFSTAKEIQIVDYIITKHFDKLPAKFQNLDFKNKMLRNLSVAVGRTAPDFSWEENGKTIKLSELNDAKHYVLVFYSTECSHCLREVPQLFEFMKGKDHVKVIAFAMEKIDVSWKKFKSTLPGWHHALGLGKWENKVARTYQIVSTPTYFVLDSSKKIIGNPEELVDLKAAVSQLKM
ncbi:MAG: TlpA family protein disulfide reductase [Flavobacteriaceae bacterium]